MTDFLLFYVVFYVLKLLLDLGLLVDTLIFTGLHEGSWDLSTSKWSKMDLVNNVWQSKSEGHQKFIWFCLHSPTLSINVTQQLNNHKDKISRGLTLN